MTLSTNTVLFIGYTSMGVLSAIFWLQEAAPFTNALRVIPLPLRWTQGPGYTLRVLAIVPKLTPMGLDLILTVLLMEHMVGGEFGPILGLAVSNVIGGKIVKLMHEMTSQRTTPKGFYA